MTRKNPILATDSYKFSHYMQYPKGISNVSSYIEARGSQIPGVTETVFAGLQIYINEVLSERVTMEDVRHAASFCEKHGTPFNRAGWERIVLVHNGYLPLRISAVPEGSVIPLQNVLVQIEVNDDELPWLTSYVETLMLSYVWYVSTVATISREIKKVIKSALEESSDDPDAELSFKLHDFGYRGVAPGAAGPGGFAHLINFMGTDTVAGIETAMEHYQSDVCGFSISASEHSTMTSWGREHEYEAYANMVSRYAKPGATFACVIDSYDIWKAISMWTKPHRGNKSLLDQVRDAGAKVVLRPDSGDAVEMPIRVIRQLMWELKEQVVCNKKGYQVLPSHVRVIQGDGIDIDDVGKILRNMMDAGMSASNIGFGMGGGLLQKVNRDTFKFAMKANAVHIDGGWKPVIKDPVTDSGKKSKGGIQILLKRQEGEYKTMPLGVESAAERKNGWFPVMRIVYDSAFGVTRRLGVCTMNQVRENAKLN